MQYIADLDIVIADARRGSDSAWRSLYRALAPQVLRYVRAHGIDDATSVLGDVFIDLARALPQFHGNAQALEGLTFHLVHARLAAYRAPASSALAPLERVLDSASRVVAGGDVAYAIALSGRMRRRIRLLSDPDRELVLLRVFGGLSEEEARYAMTGAGAVGMPAALRLSRAGEAVLGAACALVDALPSPLTKQLEDRHVQEAAISARAIAVGGETVSLSAATGLGTW